MSSSSEKEEGYESGESGSGDDLQALQRFVKLTTASAPASKSNKLRNQANKQKKLAKQQQAKEEHKQMKTKANERLFEFSKASLKAAHADAYISVPIKQDCELHAEDLDDLYKQALDALHANDDAPVEERKYLLMSLYRVAQLAQLQKNHAMALNARLVLARECVKLYLLRDAIKYYHEILDNNNTPQQLDAETRDKVKNELQDAYQSLGLTAQAATQGEEQVTAEELDAELEQALLGNDLTALEARCFTHPTVLAKHTHSKTGVTALHIACGKNQLHLVNQLIRMGGADWRQCDLRGMNSLAWALRFMTEDDDSLARELIVTHACIVDRNLYEQILTWPASQKQRVDKLMASLAK